MTLSQRYQTSSASETLNSSSASGTYTGPNSGNQSFQDPLQQSKSSSERNPNSNKAGIFGQRIELFITQHHQIHKPCVRHNNPKYHENPTIFTDPLRDHKDYIEKYSKIKKSLLITEENVTVILIREGPIRFEKFLKFFEHELLKYKGKSKMILILKEIGCLNEENMLMLNEDAFEKKYSLEEESSDENAKKHSSQSGILDIGFFKIFELAWVFWWIISVFRGATR